MKEIKVKLWDKKLHKMWPPVSVIRLIYYLIFQSHPNAEAYGAIADHFNDIVWLQYTGLHDKNDKEVYAGNNIRYKGRIFNIVWCNGGFKLMEMKPGYEGAIDFWLSEILMGCHCDRKIEDIEIVGNEYENSD